MDEGGQGQQIFSVSFGHSPMNTWSMGSRVSEHTKDALDEIGKASLFTLFILRTQGVNSKHRGIAAQSSIDKGTSIIGEFRMLPYFVCNAFCSLQHRVEIVVSDKLGSTEPQNIGMNTPPCQSLLQLLDAILRLRKGSRPFAFTQSAGLVNRKAHEGKRTIEIHAHRLNALWIVYIPFRFHSLSDESKDCLTISAAILAGNKSVGEAMPLSYRRRRIGHLACFEEVPELGAGQTFTGICKSRDDCLKLTLTKKAHTYIPCLIPGWRAWIGATRSRARSS